MDSSLTRIFCCFGELNNFRLRFNLLFEAVSAAVVVAADAAAATAAVAAVANTVAVALV